MYYAYYDPETGVVLGFYNDEIHERIPEPNVPLTHDEWALALEGQHVVEDGKLKPYAPPETEPTSSQVRAALRRQLEQIDKDSVAPLRTLVLDLARGMTLPAAAEAARAQLDALEVRAEDLRGELTG